METLALAVVLNHETANRRSPTAVPPICIQRRSADGGPRSPFITYAIEIEGHTPLTFFAEAVDD